MIITNGDAQETSQLDLAIGLFFPHAVRVRCGWHLVDRGWIRHCPGPKSVDKAKQAKFKRIIKTVKAWVYSWMKSDCEGEEEYTISKSLLYCYLRSPAVVLILTLEGANKITKFIWENIEPSEVNYCFYLRRHLRHYDTYTNSAHEGTNNGLKHCTAAVRPQNNIHKSAAILTDNVSIYGVL